MRKAEFPPDPIAAIVADNGAARRRADDAPEMKLTLPGQNRRRDQHGFARHRESRALHPDDHEDREIAVGRRDSLADRARTPCQPRQAARSRQAQGVGPHLAPRRLRRRFRDPGKSHRDVVGRAHAAERRLDQERPHAACAANAPSTAASSFSCTISRASRAWSVGWPRPHQALRAGGDGQRGVETRLDIGFRRGQRPPGEPCSNSIDRALSFVRPRPRRRRVSDPTGWGKCGGGAIP